MAKHSRQRILTTYAWAWLCLLLCLSSCATLHGLREGPRISVADIQLQKAGFLESALLLQLRVLNPNDVAIELEAITCDLALDGRSFARGVADSRKRIEPYSSTIVPVSVHSSAVEMAGAMARLLEAGVRPDSPLPYALQGQAILKVHGFQMEKPFTSKGELSWQNLKKALRAD